MFTRDKNIIQTVFYCRGTTEQTDQYLCKQTGTRTVTGVNITIQSETVFEYWYWGGWSKVFWLSCYTIPTLTRQNKTILALAGMKSCTSCYTNILILALLSKDWMPEQNGLFAVLTDPSAASVRRGLGSSLQGPTGHLQGSFLVLVPANKSSSMDKDAALYPAELRQCFVTNTAPLL